MTKLILQRAYFEDATLGFFSIEGKKDPIWYTIERPWLDNQKFVSCIPEGIYQVKPFDGNKYKDVWEIMDVPNRSAILIHQANWARQLEGCIAPGVAGGYIRDPKTEEMAKAVRESRHAMQQMKNVLGYPSEFQLEIKKCLQA